MNIAQGSVSIETMQTACKRAKTMLGPYIIASQESIRKNTTQSVTVETNDLLKKNGPTAEKKIKI